MYIVIAKENNCIMMITNNLHYLSNGYPVGDNYAVIADEVKEIVQVDSVPEGVTPWYYAYTNGEYSEILPPPPTTEEQLEDAQNALGLLGYTEEEAANG